MHEQWLYRSMMVTLITFLLLNAFLPQKQLVFKHMRKVYLVAQSLLFYLIGQSTITGREERLANRYLTFGITFLLLYFFHTHEYVGETD